MIAIWYFVQPYTFCEKQNFLKNIYISEQTKNLQQVLKPL